MITENVLLREAIEETKNLNPGEKFIVRDLFKGYLWNRIPINERLFLGTSFLHFVNTSDGSIKIIEKSSSNQQKYQIR